MRIIKTTDPFIEKCPECGKLIIPVQASVRVRSIDGSKHQANKMYLWCKDCNIFIDLISNEKNNGKRRIRKIF